MKNLRVQEKNNDLFKAILQDKLEVIVHGCNCFCTQGAGIAKIMKKTFRTDLFKMEENKYSGDINKLGIIDYEFRYLSQGNWYKQNDLKLIEHELIVVNAYSQYHYSSDVIQVDYNAIALCFKKLNHIFKGKRIGMPRIGCGLAGGEWSIVNKLIEENMKDCDVIIYSI